MKSIPAEDSEEERGSNSGSQNGSNDDQDKDSNEDGDGDDKVSEDNYDESELDEREEFKKEIMTKNLTRKEEEQLIGPRLTKKIDDFIFGV